MKAVRIGPAADSSAGVDFRDGAVRAKVNLGGPSEFKKKPK